MNQLRTTRAGGLLVAAAMVLAACGGTTPTTAPPASTGTNPSTPPASAGAELFDVGVSNTLQGNGWREQMICSINAEALSSGKVAKVTTVNHNTDTAGQIEDMRSLISAGVDIIVLNPTSDTALNAVIKEATDKGITVVAVDQAVTEPSAYVLSNDQENYGYLGAKWLFEKLGGTGKVVYMRGIDGVPADTARA
jgi:ribose transport system substrate-binding protein